MQLCVYCQEEAEKSCPCCSVCKESECFDCLPKETTDAYQALEKAIQNFRLFEYKIKKEKGEITSIEMAELHCAKLVLHNLRESWNPYVKEDDFDYNNIWKNYICIDCMRFASNDTLISTEK
jgi:hypothetical protein